MQELHGRDLGTRGRYKLRGLVARGGFGAVYRAWDSSLQREVALKVMIPTLSNEPAFVERFRREAVAVARLRHPHILEVYDFGEEPDGLLFLVMPLIEGGTLKDRFQAGGRQAWPPSDVLGLAAQMLPALDFAHERGIIHRDVKPANVLLEGDWAWLADFGIARLALGDDGGGMTLTGATAIGTPEYMAPEQVVPTHERPLDGRADLYACGVVVYELLTGRVPFRGETTWETCYQVIQAPLPSPRSLNPELSEAVAAVLVRALARDREARFGSGAELEAALSGAIDGSSGAPSSSAAARSAVEVSREPEARHGLEASNVRPGDARSSDTRPESTLASGGTLVEIEAPGAQTYLSRMWRAARLDPHVYEATKRDPSSGALVASASVVALAGISSSVGFALLQEPGRSVAALLASGVGGLVGGLTGWALWSFLAWAIGTGVFHGAGTPGQVLRAAGLAQTPSLLGCLAAIPLVGVLFYVAIGVWSLLTALGSLRQTLVIGTAQAVATLVLAGAPSLLVQFGVNLGVASALGS